MVETTKTIQYLHRGKKGTIIFFILTILITISFVVYNMMLEKQNNELSEKITHHKEVIKTLESDKNIVIYALIEQNKKLLLEMDARSQVTEYIHHLDYIKKQYKMDMRGFNLSNGSLSLKLHFTTDDEGIAYKKVVRFLSEYKKNPDALFEIGPVASISADETDIKFPVIFHLK
ncbi:MAG: hypothetical protein GY828_04145 [Candidatus Gracilibacteria bacterium]|nr:hypothetical protein [Candidatus Gracilibacteria bacterium]